MSNFIKNNFEIRYIIVRELECDLDCPTNLLRLIFLYSPYTLSGSKAHILKLKDSRMCSKIFLRELPPTNHPKSFFSFSFF